MHVCLRQLLHVAVQCLPGLAGCMRVLKPAAGCVQWAERANADGSREKWGDKWEERFKDGAGNKTVRLLADKDEEREWDVCVSGCACVCHGASS